MSDKPENPQAFPQQISDSGHIACPGMTLRDWFAGQALVGMMTRATAYEDYEINQIRARGAYRIADAMLRERAK